MKSLIRFFVICFTGLLINQGAAALEINDLLGTWHMTYNNQGAQSGTITISTNADGSPNIVLATSAGGESSAINIAIEGESLTFSRDISVQGQSLGVDYEATLVDGELVGTFELDLGGAGPGGTTEWKATREA